MGLAVEWAGYGRAGAEALRGGVAQAKAGEPLAPVTVVVPSNHVGVTARRLLASGALGPVCDRGVGIAAVAFVTIYRLAELLGAPALASERRRPVSTPVITAALRAALAESPGVFAPVAEHPATETALVGAYRELRDLSAGALDAVGATGERAGDVVGLHRHARARLVDAWYDEEDLMVAAAAVLRAGTGASSQLGPVIVYLPQRVSRHGAALLAAAAGYGDVLVVAGITGDAGADAEVVASVARVEHLARMAGADVAGGPAGAAGPPPAGAGGPAGAARTPPAGAAGPASAAGPPGAAGAQARVGISAPGGAGRTRFVTTSDADDEVRAAVRAVMDAVRAGTPLDRVAILHASPEPYARLVHDQLAAAGLPANGAAVMPLADRVAGRSLLALLALPDGGFRRWDLFTWLGAAPVRSQGRPAPVTAWERISRDAAVVAGRADWDVRLDRLATELDASAEAADADPDQPDWRGQRAREQAARTRELRSFVLALIDDLSAADRKRPWSEHARWAAGLLYRFMGDPAQRAGWPIADRTAAERVESALRRVAMLDSVEGAVDLGVFARTLALELDADLGRVGRFGEGLLVGTVAMGIGLDLDLVVVLGLAEGTFPGTVRDDSLLADHEREAAAGELALRRDRVERQHRELLGALAGARRQVLCIPRGDLRRSSERVPSRWAVELASVVAGERCRSADLLGRDDELVEHVASFDAGLRRLQFPATAQEHRLRSLLAEPEEFLDDATARGMDVVRARRSDRFTRFDGNLVGLRIPSPVGCPTSATRLERWARCPASYLFRDLLGVVPVENPEDELQITPLTSGRLVHEALEDFVAETLRRPLSSQPGPDDAWSSADRERMRGIGERCCARYEASGLTGRPIFWRRDRARILADLDRWLDADDISRRQRRCRPLAAELAFGLPGARVPAVGLGLPDGRQLSFRGRADRVDVADDGTLFVIDYKTGGKGVYGQLGDDNPSLGGRRLQLPVYGIAARLACGAPEARVEAEYWFVSAKGRFERVTLHVTPELLGRVGDTLGVMVNGIESGVFPNHPMAASTSRRVECEYCDPDALGVIELRRQWDRKRQDLTLALYADLAEPIEVEGEEIELDG